MAIVIITTIIFLKLSSKFKTSDEWEITFLNVTKWLRTNQNYSIYIERVLVIPNIELQLWYVKYKEY